MSSIPFFTPVVYQQPASFGERWLERVDHYFYLEGKRAVVIAGAPIQDGRKGFIYDEGLSCGLASIALKVASYLTLIIPLIALIAKLIFRSTHSFYPLHAANRGPVDAANREPANPATLDAFYLNHGILENPAKPVNLTTEAADQMNTRYGRRGRMMIERILALLNNKIERDCGKLPALRRSIEGNILDVFPDPREQDMYTITLAAAKKVPPICMPILVQEGLIFSFRWDNETGTYFIQA